MTNKNLHPGPKAFVSYSSADVEDARLMVMALEKRGVQCWFAERDIGPSKHFAAEIPAAMESCDVIVILLSKDSIRSPEVRREIGLAGRLGFTPYPIRLLDVALTNELAYYIKIGEWLDFDKADPEKLYDTLANAILSGRTLAPKRFSRKILAAIAVSALVMTAVIFGTAYYLSPQKSLVTELPVETAPENVGVETNRQVGAYVTDYSGGSGLDLSGLKKVRIDFWGIEQETGSVELSLYAVNTDNSLSKIAQDTVSMQRILQQSFVEIEAFEVPETYRLCAVFMAPNGKERFHFSQIFQPHSSNDPNAIREQIGQDQNCDEVVGYSGAGFPEKFETAKKISNIQSLEVIAFADRVALARLDRVEYNLDFMPFHGEADPLRKAPDATYALYGSQAGDEWDLLDTGPLLDGTSFVRQVQYRRSLPAYVRLCAITKLRSVEGYVDSERVFRSTGVSGGLEEVKSRAKDSISFGKNSECVKDTKSFEGSGRLPPLEEVFSKESAGYFDVAERERALAEIRNGRPSPYGPLVNGVQLGMAFEQALKNVQTSMPLADVSEIRPPDIFGRLVSVRDGQRHKTVLLAQHKNAETLVAATFNFEPGSIELEPQRVLEWAAKKLGTPTAGMTELSEWNVRVSWGAGNNEWCRHTQYGDPEIRYAIDTLGCVGLFLEVWLGRGDQGDFNADVGLFDAEAAKR